MNDATTTIACKFGDKCTRRKTCTFRHYGKQLCKFFQQGKCNKKNCQYSHTMPPCTHNNAPSQSVAAVSVPLKGSANGDGDGFEEYCSDEELERDLLEEELANAAEQQNLLDKLADAQQAYHILLALLHKLMPNKTNDAIWYEALDAFNEDNPLPTAVVNSLPEED